MKRIAVLLLIANILFAQEPALVPIENPAPTSITVPASTSVQVVMKSSPSSDTVHESDSVEFEVLEAVEIDGRVVITKGAVATAIVTHARRSGRGHDGEIALQMKEVRAIDGSFIPLRFARVPRKGTKGETAEAIISASPYLLYYSPLIVPAFALSAPFALLHHGKPEQLPAEDRFEVYVAEESNVTFTK